MAIAVAQPLKLLVGCDAGDRGVAQALAGDRQQQGDVAPGDFQ
jgi:hypothetical protein